jgi:NAD(P)-dependent dehydrogenase (short-subunit alcohol dehydrogenase family)
MRSLVIGASGGIGGAVATSLRERGDVTTLARRDSGLDVTDEASIAAALAPLDGMFDLIFVATGALGTPEKALRALTPDEMARQFAVNATGPALILKHALRLIPRDRRAVFASLSARVGSISDNGLGGWYSYRASKAALNQLLKTASVEIARSHRQTIIAGLHPGTVDTAFTTGYGHDKVSPDQAAANLLAVIDGLTPDQTGGFFDFAGKVVPW